MQITLYQKKICGSIWHIKIVKTLLQVRNGENDWSSKHMNNKWITWRDVRTVDEYPRSVSIRLSRSRHNTQALWKQFRSQPPGLNGYWMGLQMHLVSFQFLGKSTGLTLQDAPRFGQFIQFDYGQATFGMPNHVKTLGGRLVLYVMLRDL